MTRTARRRLYAACTAISAALLVAASAAFACQNIATLTLSSDSAHSGDTIGVTGTLYAANGAATMPVVLHWNGVDGPELARVNPDRKGAISTRFRVPPASIPGYYVVISVQKDANGADAYGTPSRVSLQVLAGPATPDAAPVLAAAATRSGGGHGGLPMGLIAAVLGVGLVGAAVVVRRSRANRVPPPRPLS